LVTFFIYGSLNERHGFRIFSAIKIWLCKNKQNQPPAKQHVKVTPAELRARAVSYLPVAKSIKKEILNLTKTQKARKRILKKRKLYRAGADNNR
jgi:hypothetical protein